MKFDINTLNQYKEDGLLMNQSHPTLPLTIWNYTARTQYEGLWDEITVNCRGLVTDLDGNVISRGFSKFFNIEENRHEPTDDFEVFEKLDGQYIGVFWYNGEMIVNSRGSFTSKYAIEARRILDEKYPSFEQHMKFDISYCFELIGFEQIVVSYPESDLVLTGMFNRFTGVEYFIHLSRPMFLSKIPIVKKYSGLDYKNIKQLNWQNSEGFVIRFSNGSRCKIKFDDYVKLHRQMTNLSTTAIWEALKDGKPVSSILNDVPDEFYDKVHAVETNFRLDYKKVKREYVAKYRKYLYHFGETRKDFALKVFQDFKVNKFNFGIIFAQLDGKKVHKDIWQLIKPKFEKI